MNWSQPYGSLGNIWPIGLADNTSVALQTDHPLVNNLPQTAEDMVVSLMHRRAYEQVNEFAAGRSVLDWGCNDGYGLEILSGIAGKIAGLDTAPHCIDAARNRLSRYADRIRLYSGERCPFGGETFDVVISFQVIEHVGEVDSYLRAVRSVLAPDGVAVFTTPNRLLRLDPEMKPWNMFHVTEYSPDDLAALLGQHFPIVSVLGLDGDTGLVGIERRRCHRARLASRRGMPKSTEEALVRLTKLTSRLGGLLPARVRHWLRPNAATRPTAELASYTTEDLRYVPERITEAIDLMALCRLRP